MAVNDAKLTGRYVNCDRTICEVHREIYDIIEEHYAGTPHFDALVAKLEEAFQMAKRMNTKLRQYKFDYDDEWWIKESKAIRQEKLARRANR